MVTKASNFKRNQFGFEVTCRQVRESELVVFFGGFGSLGSSKVVLTVPGNSEFN